MQAGVFPLHGLAVALQAHHQLLAPGPVLGVHHHAAPHPLAGLQVGFAQAHGQDGAVRPGRVGSVRLPAVVAGVGGDAGGGGHGLVFQRELAQQTGGVVLDRARQPVLRVEQVYLILRGVHVVEDGGKVAAVHVLPVHDAVQVLPLLHQVQVHEQGAAEQRRAAQQGPGWPVVAQPGQQVGQGQGQGGVGLHQGPLPQAAAVPPDVPSRHHPQVQQEIRQHGHPHGPVAPPQHGQPQHRQRHEGGVHQPPFFEAEQHLPGVGTQKVKPLLFVAVHEEMAGGPLPVQQLRQHRQQAAAHQQGRVGPALAQQPQLVAGCGPRRNAPEHRQQHRHRVGGPHDDQQAQREADGGGPPAPRGGVPAHREPQQQGVEGEARAVGHRAVDGGVVEIVGAQHQQRQSEGRHHVGHVAQQHPPQQPQAQQRIQEPAEGNGHLVGGREAVAGVVAVPGGPVPQPEEGRVQQGQADGVLHHHRPGRAAGHRKGLVIRAGGVVLPQDVGDERQPRQVVVDELGRQVQVVPHRVPGQDGRHVVGVEVGHPQPHLHQQQEQGKDGGQRKGGTKLHGAAGASRKSKPGTQAR